jgi:FkbM family methyltransferase
MKLQTTLAHMHRLLGRSEILARLARNIRNQANSVVSCHFSEIDNSISYPGEYSEGRLIDLIAPSAQNFIDVGANVGLWSSRFIASMKRPPNGLVVEPHLECFKKLQAEYGKYPEVKVVQAAVSDYIGAATFYESQSSSALSSLSSPNAGGHAERRIPVTTLDREVIALGWNRVSMVKIDAEGEDFFASEGPDKSSQTSW